jgi:hypothetical protein
VCNNIRHQLDIHQGIEALERIHVHDTMMIDCLSRDSLQRTTTPSIMSSTTTAVQACSTEQTRVSGWWAISFYFGDQE